jgi:LCP family protein required for cell wall assembly
MKSKEIKISQEESKKIQQRIKRRRKIIRWSVVAIVLCLIGSVAYASIALGGIFKTASKLAAPFFSKNVDPASLRGEGDGRINYLVMGYGGDGHQGAYLTDTMMVISIDPYNKKMAILSIPRDLWVSVPGYNDSKINAAFADGQAQNGKVSEGADLAKQTVSNILDLPIHYYIALDFSGFSKMIDAVGGVDVYVDQDIYDNQYPADNYQYQVYQISAGWHHMDGADALMYARSRYSTNDFSRAARQQKVITAFKQKILDLGFWSNPVKVASLLSSLQNNFSTDLTPQELVKTFELIKDVKENEIAQKVLDDSAGGLLVPSVSSDGQDIFLPKDSTWEAVRALAHSIFVEPFLEKENASVLIENANGESGLAAKVAQVLIDRGYTNTTYEGAASLSPTTQIMDCSNGNKPYTFELLKKRFLNPQISACSAVDKKADFVITLGQNFDYNNFILGQN